MASPPSDRRSDGGNTRSLLRLLSDERLARRAAKGDRDAFETIWRRHRENVYRFCLAMTGDPGGAREALSRIEARASLTLPTADGRVEPKPWLYRLAREETSEARRGPEGEAAQRPMAETAEARDRVHRLLDDLGQLPQRQRAVLVMRELSGLGYAEIGAAFDTSGAAARRLTCEARRALDEIARSRDEPVAIAPLPLAGLLGLVTGASEGSGLASAVGLGAGTAAGTSAAAKLTATAALVAVAVGVPTVGKSIRVDPPQRGQDGTQASIGEDGGVTEGDVDEARHSAMVARASIPARAKLVTIPYPDVDLGESTAKPEQKPALARNAELEPGAQHPSHPVATPISAVQPAGPAEAPGAGTETEPGRGEAAEVSSAGESPPEGEQPASPAEDSPTEQPAEGITSTAPDPSPPYGGWPHWSGHHKGWGKKKSYGGKSGGHHGHDKPDHRDYDEADESQAIVP